MENINNCHVFRKRICLVIRRATVDTIEYVRNFVIHPSGIYLFEIISNKFYDLFLYHYFFNRYLSPFTLLLLIFQLFEKLFKLKWNILIITEMEEKKIFFEFHLFFTLFPNFCFLWLINNFEETLEFI